MQRIAIILIAAWWLCFGVGLTVLVIRESNSYLTSSQVCSTQVDRIYPVLGNSTIGGPLVVLFIISVLVFPVPTWYTFKSFARFLLKERAKT